MAASTVAEAEAKSTADEVKTSRVHGHAAASMDAVFGSWPRPRPRRTRSWTRSRPRQTRPWPVAASTVDEAMAEAKAMERGAHCGSRRTHCCHDAMVSSRGTDGVATGTAASDSSYPPTGGLGWCRKPPPAGSRRWAGGQALVPPLASPPSPRCAVRGPHAGAPFDCRGTTPWCHRH